MLFVHLLVGFAKLHPLNYGPGQFSYKVQWVGQEKDKIMKIPRFFPLRCNPLSPISTLSLIPTLSPTSTSHPSRPFNFPFQNCLLFDFSPRGWVLFTLLITVLPVLLLIGSIRFGISLVCAPVGPFYGLLVSVWCLAFTVVTRWWLGVFALGFWFRRHWMLVEFMQGRGVGSGWCMGGRSFRLWAVGFQRASGCGIGCHLWAVGFWNGGGCRLQAVGVRNGGGCHLWAPVFQNGGGWVPGCQNGSRCRLQAVGSRDSGGSCV